MSQQPTKRLPPSSLLPKRTTPSEEAQEQSIQQLKSTLPLSANAGHNKKQRQQALLWNNNNSQNTSQVGSQGSQKRSQGSDNSTNSANKIGGNTTSPYKQSLLHLKPGTPPAFIAQIPSAAAGTATSSSGINIGQKQAATQYVYKNDVAQPPSSLLASMKQSSQTNFAHQQQMSQQQNMQKPSLLASAFNNHKSNSDESVEYLEIDDEDLLADAVNDQADQLQGSKSSSDNSCELLTDSQKILFGKVTNKKASVTTRQYVEDANTLINIDEEDESEEQSASRTINLASSSSSSNDNSHSNIRNYLLSGAQPQQHQSWAAPIQQPQNKGGLNYSSGMNHQQQQSLLMRNNRPNDPQQPLRQQQYLQDNQEWGTGGSSGFGMTSDKLDKRKQKLLEEQMNAAAYEYDDYKPIATNQSWSTGGMAAQPQQQKSKVQELFTQRNRNQAASNLMQKYNFNSNQGEDALLSRYRQNNIPNSIRSVTEQKQKSETNNFYEELYEKGELKFKNQLQSSSFSKPRPQPLPNSSKTQEPVKIDKHSKSKPTVPVADQSKMKDKILKNLNMTSTSSSSSSALSKGSSFLPTSATSYESGSISAYQKRKDDQAYREAQRLIQQKFGHLTQEKEKKAQEQKKQKELEVKQREEERKKKQKEENNQIMNMLFGGIAKETKSKQASSEQQSSNALVEQMIKAADEQKRKASEEEEEEKGQVRLSREEIERIEKLKKLRYINRKQVDELIQPILNLDLVEMFYQNGKQHFEQVPEQFECFEDYRDIWIPLFLYETYSQMINQRTQLDKDKELLEAQGIKTSGFGSKKKYFEGYIQRYSEDIKYIELKLYESTSSAPDKQGHYQLSVLDSLKEFDLLLITEEKLPCDEIKKITNADYLLKMRRETGKFMAIVTCRRKRDKSYVTVKIDREMHEEYACTQIRQLDMCKYHIYYFDSLSTTIREFRTIKSAEFFKTADIILNPTLINAPCEGNTISENKKLIMNNFIKDKKDHFNASQTEALEHVSKMKQEDFLLIQGPPGTGKTHTIQGIISMLAVSGTKRILICAPSNAAIDEIVLRLAKYKLFGIMSEQQLNEKLLRIGSMDYDPLPLVKKFTLDHKLKQALDDMERGSASKQNMNLQSQNEQRLDTIKQKLQCIYTIRRIVNTDQCEQERGRLHELLQHLLSNDQRDIGKFYKMPKQERLDAMAKLEKQFEDKREEIKKLQPEPEVQRQQPKSKRNEIERKIVQQAQIICTTLSMSVNDKLEDILKEQIEYLIVDEACQCVELTSLIPFEHNPHKVILVGDQQQLPATVFADNGDRTNYSRSLFERFLMCGVNRFMLSIQYRMHPMIRQFPSDQFYDGKLQDSEHLKERELTGDSSFAIQELSKTIQNIVFFDLKYGKESSQETSKSNIDEAKFIEAIFSDIIKILLQSKSLPPRIQGGTYSEKLDYVSKELKSKIGIITPYKSQVRTLKDHIYPKLRQFNLPYDFLEINTVDAYQGREKDIIIISCVRGSQERTLGFVNDYRRMNVAITRAKHFLWIVGNSLTLRRNQNWEAFIDYTKHLDHSEEMQPGEVCKKSTKTSSYIQLQNRDQWENHKLMGILTGIEHLPKTKDNSQSPKQNHHYYKNRKDKKHSPAKVSKELPSNEGYQSVSKEKQLAPSEEDKQPFSKGKNLTPTKTNRALPPYPTKTRELPQQDYLSTLLSKRPNPEKGHEQLPSLKKRPLDNSSLPKQSGDPLELNRKRDQKFNDKFLQPQTPIIQPDKSHHTNNSGNHQSSQNKDLEDMFQRLYGSKPTENNSSNSQQQQNKCSDQKPQDIMSRLQPKKK